MNSLRVLLVDDEPLAIRGLELRLASHEDIEIVGHAGNGREAIKAIHELKPDLVFLDIQMPGLDGFAVVRALLGSDVLPMFVFVTAFEAHAIAAFEAHALDYLLKPVEPTRLEIALRRARETREALSALERTRRLADMMEKIDPHAREAIAGALEGQDREAMAGGWLTRIPIRDRGRVTIVATSDIDYIDAAGDYLCIHVGDETHILRETMKAMERRLDPAQFQRIHRSAIVNLDRVKEVRPHVNGECFLTLLSGAVLKVSRSYRAVATRLT